MIIEEEPDEIPPYIAKANEQIFFLHSLNDNPYGKNGKLALRNEHGEVNPQISLRPGEVQRWRFVNATPDQKFISLELEELAGNAEDLEFYLIAFDGIMLCKRQLVDLGGGIEEPTKNLASLAPGNRADFLVRIKPSAKEAEFNMRSMEYYTPKNEKIPATDLITIKVEGPMTESVWSDDDSLPGPGPGLPDVDEMKKQIFRERSVTFDGGSRINKKKFDGKILMPPMQKGTVEMWTVENTSDGFHTFHIHVNPFFVLDTKYSDGNSLFKGKEEQWMRWQDSIALPPKGSVTFLTNFTDFTGKFVIHCHNLNHEDMGMMHSVEVISPKNSVTSKLLRSINARYMNNGQN